MKSELDIEIDLLVKNIKKWKILNYMILLI